MRELRQEEINKNKCHMCTDCIKKRATHQKLYCAYEECPYEEEIEIMKKTKFRKMINRVQYITMIALMIAVAVPSIAHASYRWNGDGYAFLPEGKVAILEPESCELVKVKQKEIVKFKDYYKIEYKGDGFARKTYILSFGKNALQGRKNVKKIYLSKKTVFFEKGCFKKGNRKLVIYCRNKQQRKAVIGSGLLKGQKAVLKK